MTRTTSRFRTKPGKTLPMLHFARAKKIAKVFPVFFKMVQEHDEDAWFKMQVWMLQYLIRDFKESDGAINDGTIGHLEVSRLRY